MDSKKTGKNHYEAPKLTRLGDVESLTQAIFWPGSGDIWSAMVQDAGLNPPGDGCSRYLQQYCTGS